MKKRIFGLMLIILMVISINSFDVSATDYPLLVPKEWEQTVTIGNTAYFNYDYFPAFKYEEIIVDVYNSNNTKVATCTHSFYNTSEYVQLYTVEWDTSGKPAGEYKVVATCKFYSLYRWNYAPNTLTTKITLVQPHTHSFVNYTIDTPATYFNEGIKTYRCSCGETITETIPKLVLSNTTLKKPTAKGKNISIKWNRVKGASGYEIEYSTSKYFYNSKSITVDNPRKITYKIKKLKKNKKYYIRARAYVTDGTNFVYSKWSKKSIKTKKK